VRASGDPFRNSQAGAEPGRNIGTFEFVPKVRLYVGIVGQRREGVDEPKEASPELRVVHRSSQKAIGPPGQVEDTRTLPPTQIGYPPSELLD
jgi:hypothetical protein